MRHAGLPVVVERLSFRLIPRCLGGLGFLQAAQHDFMAAEEKRVIGRSDTMLWIGRRRRVPVRCPAARILVNRRAPARSAVGLLSRNGGFEFCPARFSRAAAVLLAAASI